MHQQQKVLVVDDNLVNLAILNEILDDAYEVQYARHGIDAIRIADQCPPDIILLDVMMPGMDGLEVCRRLRSNSDLDDAVIIMVSAKAMPSERAAGIEAGADDYITKPFDEVNLLETLRIFHDGRQSLTDQFAVVDWRDEESPADEDRPGRHNPGISHY